MFKYHQEGYYAYIANPGKKFAEINPYNKIEARGTGGVGSYQVEAVPYFNGWESAKKEKKGLTGYSLFLDDFRFPEWAPWVPLNLEDNWVIAPHFYSFIEIIIKCGLPRTISFDYDLDRHNLPITHLPYGNGEDCAKWLVNYCKEHEKPFPAWTIHSTNPEGRIKMAQIIQSFIDKRE
jgi:hypothetical protein